MHHSHTKLLKTSLALPLALMLILCLHAIGHGQDCTPGSGSQNKTCYGTYLSNSCSNGAGQVQASFYRYDPKTKSVSQNATAVVTGNSTSSIYLDNNTTWQVKIQDTANWVPSFCMLKTDNGTQGWTYAQNCTASNVSDPNCTGCGTIPTTFPFNFHIGCPVDNSYAYAYLLDADNGNLLFRGPKPVQRSSNGTVVFDYEGLMSVLQERVKTQLPGAFPTKDFYFLDISLVNFAGNTTTSGPITQADILTAEYHGFGGKGDFNMNEYSALPRKGAVPPTITFKLTVNKQTVSVDGRLYWWYMKPSTTGAKNSYLPGLATLLSNLMGKKHDKPYVIYIHCNAGSDRTGEVAVSYLLTHRPRMSTKAAWIYGTTVFNGGAPWRNIPQPQYLAGAEWYAKYLMDKILPVGDTTTLPGSPSFPCLYPWDNAKNINGKCNWN